jgi:hypothetical protein
MNMSAQRDWFGSDYEANGAEPTSGMPTHGDFPVEQLVRHATLRFQRGFAHEAMRLIEDSDAFALAAVPAGLLIRGENEEALAEPLDILRQVHGEDLGVAPPRVRHLFIDGRWCEPIMQVRARVPSEHLAAVRQDLLALGASLLDIDCLADGWVIRAEAPMRDLLGYGARLRRLAGDEASHWIWLDRHAPLRPPPLGRAA